VRSDSISTRLPDSPQRWPADAFPAGPTLGAAAGLIFVYFITLATLGRAFHLSAASVRAGHLTAGVVEVQLLGYIPVVIYLCVVLPRLARLPLSAIFGGFGGAQIAFGLTGTMMMWLAVFCTGVLQSMFVHHAPQQLAIRLFENAPRGPLVAALSFIAVALAPFSEELVFRGFVFNALRRRMSFGWAASLSGLIFGAAHGEPVGVIPLAAGGVALAYVYARSGSLWSSIVAHGTFNAITLALLLLAGIKT